MASDASPYSVSFKLRAFGQLESLPKKDQKTVLATINSLAQIPRPRGTEKIKGSDGLLRIRQGKYRIIFSVDDAARKVLIVAIGDRKDVYRGF